MKTFKNYLKPFLTGISLTLIMAIIMLTLTVDFQILLFLGAVLFFLSGYINTQAKIHPAITIIIISLPFIILFIAIVLAQIPSLKYFVLVYLIACILGFYYPKYNKKVIVFSSLMTLVMVFLAVKIIPKNLEQDLIEIKSEALPVFNIEDMSGNILKSIDLKDKVIVLDFFGTWCKPCVQELVELDKVKNNFSNVDDVVFYIINIDVGGDTPEKFKSFIDKTNYNFNFVYDYKSKIYKQLNYKQISLPTLLIIDKNQNIRLQHVGYNPAETNFSENMINTIQSLR